MHNCPACHMRSLLLLVLIALPRFEGNAIDNVKGNIIIGGKDIDISKVPHMVSVLFSGRLICGGSIINKNTILTAGHCLPRIHHPWQLTVRCGSSYFNKGGRVHVAAAYKRHEKYISKPAPDYDVGLILLRDPIEFSQNAKPIALPAVVPETGTTVRISGWGETNKYESISEHLKSTEVDIVDWKQCQNAYGVLTSRMICAFRPGKDSCLGDSGGGADFNGTVVGIVSFGHSCAHPKFPGVYTNVAHPEILDFIKRPF